MISNFLDYSYFVIINSLSCLIFNMLHFFLYEYFLWLLCPLPLYFLYYFSNVLRYTIFYVPRYFPLSSFSSFFLLAPFFLVLSCLSFSFSRGTSKYHEKTNAALSVVLLSVRTSANSSLRPTNRTSDCSPFSRGSRWYQDPDIRIIGVPRGLLLPSLYGGRGSNGRPLVAVRLETLFYVSTPTFLFLASGSKSGERERENNWFI